MRGAALAKQQSSTYVRSLSVRRSAASAFSNHIHAVIATNAPAAVFLPLYVVRHEWLRSLGPSRCVAPNASRWMDGLAASNQKPRPRSWCFSAAEPVPTSGQNTVKRHYKYRSLRRGCRRRIRRSAGPSVVAAEEWRREFGSRSITRGANERGRLTRRATPWPAPRHGRSD